MIVFHDNHFIYHHHLVNHNIPFFAKFLCCLVVLVMMVVHSGPAGEQLREMDVPRCDTLDHRKTPLVDKVSEVSVAEGCYRSF